MSEAVYTPSAWQTEFHSLPFDEVLGAGAAGVGKSVALLGDPLGQIKVEHDRCVALGKWKRSGCRGPRPQYGLELGMSTGWALHLRRQLVELELTMVRAEQMFPRIDPGAKFEKAKNIWKFSSGYRFQFGHCKDEHDYISYLSSQFTHVAFDELTSFSKEQYDAITARVRSSDPVLCNMLRVRACSNPGTSPGSDPHWVRKYFVDPAPEGRKVLTARLRRRNGEEFTRTRMYLPGRLSDNPDKTFQQTYEATLLSKPAHIRRAYLEGDWYFTPGAFFEDAYDPAIHEIEPFRIPLDWPIFRAMDWGYKTAGQVGWYAFDPDECLIKFDEFYFSMMTDKQVAERIKQIETRHGLWDLKTNRSRITGPADTQIWEERGDSAKTKAQVFKENGVDWERADKKSREDNAQRVTKRLVDHDHYAKPPGLMFMKNCVKTISCIKSIPTDPNKPEEPLKGGDDHPYDETSYAVAKAAGGPRYIFVRNEKRDEFDEDDSESDNSSGGRYGYGSRYR